MQISKEATIGKPKVYLETPKEEGIVAWQDIFDLLKEGVSEETKKTLLKRLYLEKKLNKDYSEIISQLGLGVEDFNEIVEALSFLRYDQNFYAPQTLETPNGRFETVPFAVNSRASLCETFRSVLTERNSLEKNGDSPWPLDLSDIKIHLFDVRNLKAMNLAGSGDFFLSVIVATMQKEFDKLLAIFQDENPSFKANITRYGGDEFAVLSQGNEVLSKKFINQLSINISKALLKTPTKVKVENEIKFTEAATKLEELIIPKDPNKLEVWKYYMLRDGRPMSEAQIDQILELQMQGSVSVDFQVENDNLLKEMDHLSASEYGLQLKINNLCEQFPFYKIIFDIAKRLDEEYNSNLDKIISTNEKLKDKAKFSYYLFRAINNRLKDAITNTYLLDKTTFKSLIESGRFKKVMKFSIKPKWANEIGNYMGDLIIQKLYEKIPKIGIERLKKFVIIERIGADICITIDKNMPSDLEEHEGHFIEVCLAINELTIPWDGQETTIPVAVSCFDIDDDSDIQNNYQEYLRTLKEGEEKMKFGDFYLNETEKIVGIQWYDSFVDILLRTDNHNEFIRQFLATRTKPDQVFNEKMLFHFFNNSREQDYLNGAINGLNRYINVAREKVKNLENIEEMNLLLNNISKALKWRGNLEGLLAIKNILKKEINKSPEISEDEYIANLMSLVREGILTFTPNISV